MPGLLTEETERAKLKLFSYQESLQLHSFPYGVHACYVPVFTSAIQAHSSCSDVAL